jgi:RNA polymerase sigma-70 factor (ECF subfamily)
MDSETRSAAAPRAPDLGFEALIDPLVPALRRFAWTLIRNDDEADDLVQDCLERAFRRWGGRRSEADLKSWLFTILYNLRVSRWRAWERRGGDHLPVENSEYLASPDASAEQKLIVQDVLAGLQMLPENQRAVLVLVGVEGLSYEEAAQVLGAPIGTVMSRLSRGRERLRGYVEGELLEQPKLRSAK